MDRSQSSRPRHEPVPRRSATVVTPRWVTDSHDTLWDIAATALGDGARVDEIIRLNPGVQNARQLRPGRTIQLPADAHVPSGHRPNPQPGPPTTTDIDASSATITVSSTAHRLDAPIVVTVPRDQ